MARNNNEAGDRRIQADPARGLYACVVFADSKVPSDNHISRSTIRIFYYMKTMCPN